MPHRSHALPGALAAVLSLAIVACSDPATSPLTPTAANRSAVKFWEVGSSVAWNETARGLLTAHAASPAAQARVLAYLSVAQYNAVVAAEKAKDGGDHPSPAAAAAGASVVVLKRFFPLDAALIDGALRAQQAGPRWPGERNRDVAAGEAVGREIGAAVVAYAATDNFNRTPAPPNPGLPGSWTGVNSIRGLYGTRTFALTSGDQFRPEPPPAYGSPAFTAALQEVRAFSDGLTPAQRAIALRWAPNGPAYMNGIAAEMIVAHHRSEREAARILALANMAGFDVGNACFDAKFAYYLIRPTQVDPLINLVVPLPNHPSYPSGHSCFTAAYATVLASAFPEERDLLDAMVEEAGLSRIYGGLHYRFDCDVGQELGRQVAAYVLHVAVNGHQPIPLD